MAYTTSAPSRHLASMSGTSDTGCWPSPSISTTTSPCVASMPAVSAASLPKFRDSFRYNSCGQVAQSVCITSSVSSRLPSSTTISSTCGLKRCSVAKISGTSVPRLGASLYAGMTHESEGDRVWRVGMPASCQKNAALRFRGLGFLRLNGQTPGISHPFRHLAVTGSFLAAP